MHTIRREGPDTARTGAGLASALLLASLGWLSACSSGEADSAAAGTASSFVTRGVLVDADGLRVNDRPLVLSDSEVLVNGVPADASALHPGMRLTVSGERDVSTRVSYEEDVKGPLDAVLSDGTLSVMGQLVRVSPETVFDDANPANLRAGDVLEVSGLRLANGAIEASYVERKSDSPNAYSVRGPVRELDTVARVFRIGGLGIDYSGARIDDGITLRNGVEAEVKQDALVYEPGSLFLMATEVGRGESGVPASPPLPTPPTGEDNSVPDGSSAPSAGDGGVGPDATVLALEYEIDGVVSGAFAGSSFVMGALEVEVDADTRYRGGAAADLVIDRRVEVEGRIDARGVLLARDIEFHRDGASHRDEDIRDDDDRDDRNGDDREDGDARVEIEGTVTEIDATAGTLTIGGLRVATAATTQFENAHDQRVGRGAFFALLVPGRTVVKARWASGSAAAPHEIEIED